jgi:hypothetical protein
MTIVAPPMATATGYLDGDALEKRRRAAACRAGFGKSTRSRQDQGSADDDRWPYRCWRESILPSTLADPCGSSACAECYYRQDAMRSSPLQL